MLGAWLAWNRRSDGQCVATIALFDWCFPIFLDGDALFAVFGFSLGWFPTRHLYQWSGTVESAIYFVAVQHALHRL